MIGRIENANVVAWIIVGGLMMVAYQLKSEKWCNVLLKCALTIGWIDICILFCRAIAR